jgi:orotate phosphoribosyltransferase
MDRFALNLFDCGAFRHRYGEYTTPPVVINRSGGESGFELARHESQPKAPLSPYYITLRTASNPEKPGPLTNKLVAAAGDLLGAYVFNTGHLVFDAVVGLPNAGAPFADAFPPQHWYNGNGIAKLRLRKEIQGGKRSIVGPPEGQWKQGCRVLVIDDVITGAHTKLKCIETLESHKLTVVGVAVIIDRQEGGSEELRHRGYSLYSPFPLIDLLNVYVHHARITHDLKMEILRFAEENRKRVL